MDKVAVVAAVARRWNDAGVVYAVAHGIDGWPTRLGRDLDVVVDQRDVPRAIAIAREVLHAHGLAVASPPPLWGERLIAAERESPDELLEIHTTPRITWRNTTIADRPVPSARVGPFAIDPWVSVAKCVVLPLLAGRTRVLRTDPARLVLDDAEREAARRHLRALAGPRLAAHLLAALAASDPDAIDALGPPFRRAVLRRSATLHPLRAARVLWHSLARRVQQPLRPCAPVVAVVGASTRDAGALVRTIADGDRLIFTDLVVRPRDLGGTAVGRLIRDRVDSSRQRLVLYDGYLPGDRSPASRAGERRPAGRLPRVLDPGPDLTILLAGADAGAALGTGRRAGMLAVLPPDAGADELRRRAVSLIINAFMAKNGGAWRPAPG